MKKNILFSTALLLFSLVILGNSFLDKKPYREEYFIYFDTHTSFTCYAKSKKEFDKYSKLVQDSLELYSSYFDIYNDYANINNVKTINDNAGLEPVKVDSVIIDFLIDAKKNYYETDGSVNIAMGSVLKLWHEYREEGTAIPSLGSLEKAAQYIDIENLIVDEINNTVFISEQNSSIDVGATAKGYSAKLISRELKSAGAESFLINIGGDIYAAGTPKGMKSKPFWNIGIQSPVMSGNEMTFIETLALSDMSIVTSGDYQRYYTVDDINYHHIIDPKTLMPAENLTSVTVISEDAEIADLLSTALFILPYEEGVEICKKYEAEAIWVFKNGTTAETIGFDKLRKID